MRVLLQLLTWGMGLLGVVLLGLYLFALDVWRVPEDDPLLSASIQPTLAAGDLLVVTRRTGIGRGDLLRCADPQAPGRFVVARAIGEGGEMVALERELVSVDGHRAPSPRGCDVAKVTVFDPNRNDDIELDCSIEEFGDTTYAALRARDLAAPPTKTTVESGKWFLVSDDRHVHLDSRDFGQIDPATCQHIVFRIEGRRGLGDSRTRLSVIW